MNETSFCASHCFSRESLAKETCDERGRVAAVSKVFDDVFQLPQCTFLKRADYKEKILLYEGRIQKTVDRLGSYFKKAMEEKDFPTITPPEAMEEKDPPPAVTELIYFPGCTSQEVPGVQPVIATLLRAIGSCCHLSHDMEKSFHWRMVSQNKIPRIKLHRRKSTFEKKGSLLGLTSANIDPAISRFGYAAASLS